MKRGTILMFVLAAVGLFAASGAIAADASVAAMQWRRRVLVIAAPGADDPRMAQQRRILEGWSDQAAQRDITVVEVAGSRVVGASDPAEALRRRDHLPSGAFEVLLIGKDGHVAMRSSHPIEASTLQATIDAMPMRRAGQR